MNEGTGKVPAHLWIVGVLSLLWNCYGGYDYFMSKTRGDAYFTSAGMTAEQISYVHGLPVWMTAVWAIGVWGAILGSILLLLRNKLAVPVFLASLLGFVLSQVYYHVIAPMPGAGATNMWVMTLVILAGCVFFLWYAARSKRLGLLR